MPALGEDQAAIDDYVFGYGTAIDIVKLDLAYPDVLVQDKPMPREDGQSMGIDRLGGRTVNLELEILGQGEGDALELSSDLTDAFMGDNARQQPQTYQVLSYLLHGTGEQRRMFGRGRACAAASLENVHVGFIPVAAQFQTITPHCLQRRGVLRLDGLIPDDTGGLQGYLIGPLYATHSGAGSRGFEIGGSRPAWLATRIHGPITDPAVEVPGGFWYQLAVTVAAGDSVLVDPQPWSRQVRRQSDGANLAGYLPGRPRGWRTCACRRAGGRSCSAATTRPGRPGWTCSGAPRGRRCERAWLPGADRPP